MEREAVRMTALLWTVLVLGACNVVAAKMSPNTCSVFQGGCTYTISLQGRDCMMRDGPVDVMVPPSLPDSNMDVKVERKLDELIKEDKQESKKLDELERKLIKLMEGLSVRSLRHIRHIRNDLRQLSTSMSLLKQQAITTSKTGKKKRGLSCPPEFVGVGTWSSCYRFSNFNTTWHEAREYCNAFGADLVALDSLKESYILDYLIKSNPELEPPPGWWTSGNYIARTEHWMWTTKHHLVEMTYEQWADTMPRDVINRPCIFLARDYSYMWHNADCNDRRNFICEIQP